MDNEQMTGMTDREQLNQELGKIYIEIGRRFYEDRRNDPRPAPRYAELFAKAAPVYAELVKLDNAELAAQGLKRCPSCKNKSTLESLFCNMCGYRFTAQQETAAQQPAVRTCKGCGAPLEDDAVFCANCGQKQ